MTRGCTPRSPAIGTPMKQWSTGGVLTKKLNIAMMPTSDQAMDLFMPNIDTYSPADLQKAVSLLSNGKRDIAVDPYKTLRGPAPIGIYELCEREIVRQYVEGTGTECNSDFYMDDESDEEYFLASPVRTLARAAAPNQVSFPVDATPRCSIEEVNATTSTVEDRREAYETVCASMELCGSCMGRHVFRILE
jgi:hypothetical protein